LAKSAVDENTSKFYTTGGPHHGWVKHQFPHCII